MRDYVASRNAVSPYSKTRSTFRQRFPNNNSVLVNLLSATAQAADDADAGVQAHQTNQAPTREPAQLASCSQQASAPAPPCKYLRCNLPSSSNSLNTPANPPPPLQSGPCSRSHPALHYGSAVGLLWGDRSLIKIVNEDLIFHFKWATEL